MGEFIDTGIQRVSKGATVIDMRRYSKITRMSSIDKRRERCLIQRDQRVIGFLALIGLDDIRPFGRELIDGSTSLRRAIDQTSERLPPPDLCRSAGRAQQRTSLKEADAARPRVVGCIGDDRVPEIADSCHSCE